MGMTDEQRAAYQRFVDALVPPAQQSKPAVVKEDATFGNEELIRGIPAVGRVSGTIKGTRPGDPASTLEQANRDLHQSLMRRARLNLKGEPA